MIQDRTIICLGSSWDLDPTSKHQVMKILSRHNHVVWVNYHGTRSPAVSAADLRAVCSALRRVAKGVSVIHERMVQVTPFLIPGSDGAIVRRLNRTLLLRAVRQGMAALPGAAGNPIQVWSFAPDVPHYVGAMGEERFVYYCTDEYSEFDGFDGARIRRLERQLVDRADVVVTTSEPLFESRRQWRSDVHLVRHGVDYDHFARAWREPLPVPEELAPLRVPIFGFFGLIHHWIDLALLAEAARLRPDYAFVLIGEAGVDVTSLAALPNVHLLGRRSYASLPGYCSRFCAALLPFAQSRMTPYINPIKMLEYLAAGLPVISSPLPEAQRYPEAITIVRDARQFAEACDRAVADGRALRGEPISRLARDKGWDAIVERLSGIVLHGRSQGGAESAPPSTYRVELPSAQAPSRARTRTALEVVGAEPGECPV